MTTIYKYRIYCNTENLYINVWDEVEPGKCPNANNHSIDKKKTVIVDQVDKHQIKIQEENTPTNGNFTTNSIL